MWSQGKVPSPSGYPSLSWNRWDIQPLDTTIYAWFLQGWLNMWVATFRIQPSKATKLEGGIISEGLTGQFAFTALTCYPWMEPKRHLSHTELGGLPNIAHWCAGKNCPVISQMTTYLIVPLMPVIQLTHKMWSRHSPQQCQLKIRSEKIQLGEAQTIASRDGRLIKSQRLRYAQRVERTNTSSSAP